jgi:hypothetical protein
MFAISKSGGYLACMYDGTSKDETDQLIKDIQVLIKQG